MKVLLIGGTGLISTGIVKHLLARQAEVTMFNRGKRENRLPTSVKQIEGDRNDAAGFKKAFEGKKFDCVIDMIAFHPDQVERAVDVFGGKCEQYIFCSTVCTYGVKVPANVLVDESMKQEPISEYGRNKVACEQIVLKAHQSEKFKGTIIRPSCTYGPGAGLIDNLEGNAASWDRVEKNLPILCGGDGLGLWVSTHRDDCGKLFAYGAMNPKTYGESYNATRDQNWTWRDQLKETGEAMGKKVRVIFMPASWIAAHDPSRFGLLREITQFHGAYSSEKAKRDVPEFKCEIEFREGAAETIADMKRRGAFRSSEGDLVYNTMVDKALKMGVEPVEL